MHVHVSTVFKMILEFIELVFASDTLILYPSIR